MKGPPKKQVIAAEGAVRDTTCSMLEVECVGSQQCMRLQGFYCGIRTNRIGLKSSYEIWFQWPEHRLTEK